MLEKSSRAFRTISEAGEELDLKPHVLRFWEAKFSDLKPVTRAGGRRFYRPEDINFLRGLRILLHDEKHKIKDVQKLIKLRGVQSVVDLGESAVNVRPSRPIEQRDLVPERIKGGVPTPLADEVISKVGVKADTNIVPFKSDAADPVDRPSVDKQTPPDQVVAETPITVKPVIEKADTVKPVTPDSRFLLRQPSLSNPVAAPSTPTQTTAQADEATATQPAGLDGQARADLEIALDRLSALRKRWEKLT